MGTVEVGVTPVDVWIRLRDDWLCVGVGETQFDAGGQFEGVDCKEIRDREITFESVSARLLEQVEKRRDQLVHYAEKCGVDTPSALMVLVAGSDPVDFLSGVWAALLEGWTLALANPRWGIQEWQSAKNILHPTLFWHTSTSFDAAQGISKFDAAQDISQRPNTPAILIPTGGSSGQIKFAHHTWQTLVTAVVGFHHHFLPCQLPIHAYCVLPLHHVSGFLQVLRTALTNGQLFLTCFKPLLIHRSSFTVHPSSFISLVPTQLDRLLRADRAPWLSTFHTILLGGAPLWPDLLVRAIAHQLPLCFSYGMTETAAMVSATDPQQTFLPGDRQLGSGHAMPHAVIQIERAQQSVAVGEIGQVVVRSGAIAHGYYGMSSACFAANTFYTDDLGYLDTDGTLHITGRASSKIISGGENIFPAEVESALRSTGQVTDVCVIGLAHPDWGEAVSAVYVPKDASVSAESLKAALVEVSETEGSALLSRYKVPKYWFSVTRLPRNAQGKLNRSALRAQLETLSNSSAQEEVAGGGESEARCTDDA
ncbi:MAG: AMP-binding protein [Cyanobacteria bacterium J06632_3]